MPDVLVRLPASRRADLKDPLGPVETDVERLLERVDGPVIAVGDVVTYHLEAAGHTPALSIVDGRTERSPVDEAVRAALGDADREVENPAATLTASLVAAIRDGLAAAAPTRILVDGEEDLAVLPAIIAAPTGASVVYGQPGEGMVRVEVDGAARRRARELIRGMDGDPGRLLDLIDA